MKCCNAKTLAVPLALAACLAALPVFGQEAWTMEHQLGDVLTLSLIDLAALQTTPVGEVDLFEAVAITRGVGDELWLVGQQTSSSAETLYRLNASSLALEEIGELSLTGAFVRDLAWLSDGRLMMSAAEGATDGLYEVDIATGSASLISEVDEPLLVLGAVDDQLFSILRTDPDFGLFDIDPDDATPSFLFDIPADLLGFENSLNAGPDGRLYLLGAYSFPIAPPTLIHLSVRIDPISGALDLLGEELTSDSSRYIGVVPVSSQAVIDVPGPGAAGQVTLWTLLLVAGLTTIRYRQMS